MVVLLIVVAVLVLLLLIPLQLKFAGSWPSQNPVKVRVQWCFGLVNFETALPSTRESDPSVTGRPDKKRRRKKDDFPVGKLLAQRRFRVRTYRLFSNLWRAIEKRDIKLRLRLGTGDPAETGQLWAYLGPLSGLMHCLRNSEVALIPEFDHAVFEGEASGQLGFAPARLLAPIIAYVFSPVMWSSVARSKA